MSFGHAFTADKNFLAAFKREADALPISERVERAIETKARLERLARICDGAPSLAGAATAYRRIASQVAHYAELPPVERAA